MAISTLTAANLGFPYSLTSSQTGGTADLQSLTSQYLNATISRVNASQITTGTFAQDRIQISGFGKIFNALSSFETAASSIGGSTAVSLNAATASDTSVLTAATDINALAESRTISVTQLAQAQTLVSTSQADTTSGIGSGAQTTLTFQFGTATASTFTSNPDFSPLTVSIDSTTNSLDGIAAAINDAKIGVSASVIGVEGSYQLQISSDRTGLANSLSITVAGDATLQSLLSFNPGATSGLTQTVAGQDAQLSIDDDSLSSASNTITGAITGVTLNLSGTGSSTVTVAPAPEQFTANVTGLIAAFNSLQSTLGTLASGELKTDPLLLAVRSQITGILGSSQGLESLAKIGIAGNADGSLTLDSDLFQQALTAKPTEVQQTFANNGLGVADQLLAAAKSYTDSGTGLIPAVISSLSNASTGTRQLISTSVASANANQAALLQSQFNSLNRTLLSVGQTNQYLVTQLSELLATQLPVLSAVKSASSLTSSSSA